MALAPFVSDVQLSPQNLREKNMELRKLHLKSHVKRERQAYIRVW